MDGTTRSTRPHRSGPERALVLSEPAAIEAEPDDAPTEGEQRRAWLGSDRLAAVAFGVFAAVGALLVLFHYGTYHWFFRDDFEFLANRDGTWPPLMRPHGGSHWVAIPRLVYLALWQVVGLRSYVPYQACVVALHISVVVLLRVIMRRAGVGPWLASAAAAVLVLFGPGAQNIVWAFQVGFTGAVALGLLQLVLSDHDGGLDRRDVLGLLAGTAAMLCAGVGVTMAAVVGLATLLRRGWRAALFHAVPPAAVYAVWSASSGARTEAPFGRPSPSVLVEWVRSAEIGTFLGLGHFQVVAGLLALVLVVGTALVWGPWRDDDLRSLLRRHAVVLACFVGSFLFAASTGIGRWYTGEHAARSERYLYIGAALTLPLLAVAAQALARRWRFLLPGLLALFLVPVPFNVDGFTPPVFGKGYMADRQRVLTTAVRMPFARQVPSDVQPIPDPFASDAVTMGFLLGAEQAGSLTPSSFPLTPATIAEFEVRLGVAARPAEGPVRCPFRKGPIDLAPERGDTLLLASRARIVRIRDGRPAGPPVAFAGTTDQNELTIELDDLELRILPARGAAQVAICPPS